MQYLQAFLQMAPDRCGPKSLQSLAQGFVKWARTNFIKYSDKQARGSQRNNNNKENMKNFVVTHLDVPMNKKKTKSVIKSKGHGPDAPPPTHTPPHTHTL